MGWRFWIQFVYILNVVLPALVNRKNLEKTPCKASYCNWLIVQITFIYTPQLSIKIHAHILIQLKSFPPHTPSKLMQCICITLDKLSRKWWCQQVYFEALCNPRLNSTECSNCWWIIYICLVQNTVEHPWAMTTSPIKATTSLRDHITKLPNGFSWVKLLLVKLLVSNNLYCIKMYST